VTVIEGVDCLLPLLSSEPPPKRSATRETLTEALVANLGDSTARLPYLIVCTVFFLQDGFASNKNLAANRKR
jgi:cleavage and polyadenylation specificity factor subunit 1